VGRCYGGTSGVSNGMLHCIWHGHDDSHTIMVHATCILGTRLMLLIFARIGMSKPSQCRYSPNFKFRKCFMANLFRSLLIQKITQ